MLLAALMVGMATAGVEPLARFGPGEGWQVWWPADRGPAPATLETLPEDRQTGRAGGLRIVVSPRSSAVDLVLFAPPLRSTLVSAGTGWELGAEAAGAVRPSVWINATDRAGRGFVYPEQSIPPTPGRLIFPATGRRFGWGTEPDGPPKGELNLHEVTVRVPASDRPVTVRLGDIKVSGHGVKLTRLRSRLLAPDELGLFQRVPADVRPVRLLLTGTPLARLVGEAATTDWRGRPLSRAPIAGRLDADGRMLLDLSPAGPLGLRNVQVQVREDGGELIDVRHTYAVFDPVPPADATQEFRLGLQGEEMEKWIHAAARVGASIFRTGIDLREIRPDPARPFDFSRMDARIALIRKLGMEPQGLVAYGIPWATPERHHQFETRPDGTRVRKIGWPDGFVYPVEEGPWRTFVRAVSERYRGQIPVYEIWNEPDITVFYRGSTPEYLAMLRQAAEEILRADPTARVGTGGFAFPPFETDVYGFGNPGLQEAVLRDAKDAFDVHILHLHGDYASFRWGVETSVLPLRQRLGTRQPILFNETSYSEHLPEREIVQASELVKKATYAWSVGATGLVWFKLWMSPNDVPSEYGYSMFRGELETAEPKAVWPAFAALARTLRGHRFVREWDLGPGQVGFLFRDPKGWTAYLWRQDAAQASAPLAVRVGGEARTVDLMGNAAPLPAASGVVVVEPSDVPVALRVEGGPEPRVLEAVARAKAPPLVPVDATETTVSVELWNPGSGPASASLRVAGARGTERLGPGERRALTVRVAGTELAEARSSRGVSVDWSVGPWRGNVSVPIRTVWTLGTSGPDGRVPDVVPDMASRVTRLVTGVPDPEADWRGPGDLSANVWTWVEDGDLRLRVDVRDDRVWLGPNVEQMWRGDSVQVAVAPSSGPGFWEFGAVRSEAGTAWTQLWAAPAGRGPGSLRFRATAEPIAGGIRYGFAVPLDELGVSKEARRDGFRMALVVNDADSERFGRKTALCWGDGLVLRKEPYRFAWVRVR